MLATVLALTLQAAPVAPPDPTIVVTGIRLTDLRADLDRCIATRCPTRADIVATVRYAEGLFRTGDYQGAKTVLGEAVRRNRGAAAAEPVALSELYTAQATVAAHHGEQRDYRSGVVNSAQVLREHLAPGARLTLLAELRVAELKVRDGNLLEADRSYLALRGRAAAANEPDVVAGVDLHRAALMQLRGSSKAAIALLKPLIASPPVPWVAEPAQILSARIARAAGDGSATDTLATTLATAPARTKPVLIWSPPLPEPTQPVIINDFDILDTQTRPTDLAGLQWVDIGFTIRNDGTVATPEVLRGSRRAAWAPGVVSTIAARRYTPFADGSPGQYRVERFTLTADFATPIGSLVRRRAKTPRIEQIDMSEPTRVVGATKG